jgi:purine nucleoside permease
MRFVLVALWLCVEAFAQRPLPVKVVVVTMFEPGEDVGDAPGEFQLWVEREHLDRVLDAGGGYHQLRMNKDGVLGMVTGIGTAKAAASVMALGMDPRFDLTKAYWIVAGIGGGDPADVSLASAVWATHVVDGDLGYEIDARDIPADWTTGFVPLRRKKPYEEPVRDDLEGEMYKLNESLVNWAFQLTRDTPLKDTAAMKASRTRFTGFPNGLRPPFVAKGAVLASSTFWHGSRFEDWANQWTRYYTRGEGNYMVSAMEDSGTMQALTLLGKAGRVDAQRALVLRTVSNFDREAPGATAVQSLQSMGLPQYSAYLPALESAQQTASRAVHYLIEHWKECRDTLPGQK